VKTTINTRQKHGLLATNEIDEIKLALDYRWTRLTSTNVAQAIKLSISHQQQKNVLLCLLFFQVSGIDLSNKSLQLPSAVWQIDRLVGFILMEDNSFH